ncbi:MAG TPA: ribosome biogenesis GTP-binding protein YihA/YsxC [Bacteroidales bacterium]|nr:ribosome biogenesis GTP-binding protein YihA/YsxC [Bacteroidales bacterium]
MLIKSAQYISSCVELKKCPKPVFPEYAFIGRSNVGKSSLINMLTGTKGLAKVSASPGKTRVINHFLINGDWYLVDLPGYGFARISKDLKKEWNTMISNYLIRRKSLLCTFVLVDIRVPVQKNDLDFINNMGESQLPFIILMTKYDKVSKQEGIKTVNGWKKALSESWEECPQIMVTSAETGHGRDEVLDFIDKNNRIFTVPAAK